MALQTHFIPFAAYLDKFRSAFHELEILGDEKYSEAHKKHTLLKNVRRATGIVHLVQKCHDDFDIMTFDGMAQYLRQKSKNEEMKASSNSKEVDACYDTPDGKSMWQAYTMMTLAGPDA